ncbi:MAG TPA: hypothetical protein PLQ93_03445 [Bacteroidia bacterium]|nr:hypothetical protein [Bacteroidia bacterium]
MIRLLMILLGLGLVHTLPGQSEKLYRAQILLKSKTPANIDQAVFTIDSVIHHPSTNKDFTAWSTRAAIYYEIYKRNDKFKLNSWLRDTVISSVHVSNSLKPDSSTSVYNNTLLTSLAKGYYNISVKLLQDSLDHDRSYIAYQRYKAMYKDLVPNFDFKSQDILYYLFTSTVYNDKYAKDSSVKSLEVSKYAYRKVLDLEPENRNANMGLGLLHYNEAVVLSKQLEFGADLDQIEAVQDNMVKLAKESEHYILVVYNKDKNDSKAVEALYYIYRMLLDKPKHEDFKKKCSDLGIIVNEEKASGG